QTKELIGVLQLINTLSGEPFPQAMEEGVGLLCETLAIALRQRQQRPMMAIKGKYDALVANTVASARERGDQREIRRARRHRGGVRRRARERRALRAAQEPRHRNGADRRVSRQAE